MSAHSDNAARAARGSVETFCKGKQKFDSHRRATQIADRSNRRNDSGYSAYLCPNCSHWHLGTHKGRATTKKRRDFNLRKEEQE